MQHNNIENFFLTMEKIAIITEKIYNHLYLINSNYEYSFFNIKLEVHEIQSLAKEIGIQIGIKISSLESRYKNNKEKLQHDINTFIFSVKIVQSFIKSKSVDLSHINHIKANFLKIFRT